MLNIEKRKKYKEEKKIQKEIEKRQKQIEKHRISLEKKKSLAIEKYNSEQSIRYEKKLVRIVKSKQRKLDTFIRAEKGLKSLKPKPEKNTWKGKAKEACCMYAKLLRTGDDGYVTLLDTGERVHWSKSVGGHFFSVSGHPQVQYDLNNVRPITRAANKIQGTADGFWIDNLRTRIGVHYFEFLKNKAKDKTLKNRKYDSTYHREQFEYFSEKICEILKNKPQLEAKSNIKYKKV